MPNRIIKESVCTSDNLDALTWFEECLFYRLIVNCDDYGRMDARTPILRSRLFPLKSVTDAQIAKGLQSLRSAAMIDLYEVDGRSYLQMRTWERHQQMRAKRSKYPPPDSTCNHLQSDDINCNQMISDVPVIQSESESESESNPKEKGKTARFAPPTTAEAAAYFAQKGSSAQQAERFCDFYASKGWRVGNAGMKDWRAAARNWIARDRDTAGAGRTKGGDTQMMRYTPEERKQTYSAAVVNFDEE